MKAIQITVDPELLARLDATEQVKRKGRSAVIRAAVDAWLRRQQEADIVDEYRRAYGQGAGLGEDWDGWDKEGEWPSE